MKELKKMEVQVGPYLSEIYGRVAINELVEAVRELQEAMEQLSNNEPLPDFLECHARK